MAEENETAPPKDGDVLLPHQDGKSAGSGAGTTEILALISNQTDRPDLFLAEAEKHDPGFVKRMNASAEAHFREFQEKKYKFGHRQAYASLALQIIAASSAIFLIGVSVFKGNGFWIIIALVIFYSVSQGGRSGFMKIIDASAETIKRFRDKR